MWREGAALPNHPYCGKQCTWRLLRRANQSATDSCRWRWHAGEEQDEAYAEYGVDLTVLARGRSVAVTLCWRLPVYLALATQGKPICDG